MGKPHPLEMRERVVAFVDDGHSHRAAARHFRVSPKFVNDMIKLRRDTGGLAPKRQGNLGRTGKLLADRHEDAEPDVTLIGKALAGGYYPVSAVLSNSEVLGVLKPGEHGSTFGGNPLACAVANAALKVLVEENMVENSAEMGAYFLDGLRQIDSQWIKEIRGRGLMIGLELKSEAGGARPYCEQLKESGILCKDTHNDIIRISPPLVIIKEEIDWALERFESVLTKSPAGF